MDALTPAPFDAGYALLTPDEVVRLFHTRASTRTYTGVRIPQEVFLAILEAGRLSPSSVGSEPWQFLVLKSEAVKEAIAPFSWGIKGDTLHTASHIIALIAKKSARFDSPFFDEVMTRKGLNDVQKSKARAVYERFQSQDMPILDNDKALFDWASKQTYIALANMMTAAQLLGVDTCPIEGFDYALMDKTLSDFGLYDANQWGISVMLTLGYRMGAPNPKTRKPLHEATLFVE